MLKTITIHGREYHIQEKQHATVYVVTKKSFGVIGRVFSLEMARRYIQTDVITNGFDCEPLVDADFKTTEVEADKEKPYISGFEIES